MIEPGIEEFRSYVEDAVRLEELISGKNSVEDKYAGYMKEPQPFVAYKNVANIALITLPLAWCVFDAFAIYSHKTAETIGGIAATLVLFAIAIIIKYKTSKLNAKNKAEYEKKLEIHEGLKGLAQIDQRISSLREAFYKKEWIYPRYRSLQGVKNIRDVMNADDTILSHGLNEIFHAVDRLPEKKTEEKSEEKIEEKTEDICPVKDADDLKNYMKSLCSSLDELESKLR